MTQISLRKSELATQVHMSDVHTPCRWNPKGLTHQACAETSALLVRNVGCAEMNCTSPMRACKVCVTSGGEWQPIVDFETGLCKRHQEEVPTARTLSPYESSRELPDLASHQVFMLRTKDDRRPPLPPTPANVTAQYRPEPEFIAKLLAPFDDYSKRIARSIAQEQTVDQMAEWLCTTRSFASKLRNDIYRKLCFHSKLAANERHDVLREAFVRLGWDVDEPVTELIPTDPNTLIEAGVSRIKYFTPQERNVFELVGKCHTKDFVSRELNIKLKYVHTVVGKLYQKLGIDIYVPEGRSELLVGIWLKHAK